MRGEGFSRRSLLGGLLALLFAWLGKRQSAAGATPPPKMPLPAPCDGLATTVTYTYDGQNRLTGTMDPVGPCTTTVYDPAGRVLSVTDPLGQTTTYIYDALG